MTKATEEITTKSYADAVNQMIRLARQSTSGARAAAQVLLSAYNGDAFQLDLSDLCNLDRTSYAAAIMVIRGRKETGYEPHHLIEDGSETFRSLWDKWEHLHILERSKKTCRQCYGEGKIHYDSGRTETCPGCLGHGRLCACKA